MQNYSEDTLRELLEEQYSNVRNHLRDYNEREGLTCQILQSELLYRGIVKLIASNEKMTVAQDKNRKQTKRFSSISITLTVVMILFAGITIHYASRDSIFDKDWMVRQEVLLKEINTSIVAIPNNTLQMKNDTIIKNPD